MKQTVIVLFCLLSNLHLFAQSGFFKEEFQVPNESILDHVHISTFDGGTISLIQLYDSLSSGYTQTIVKCDAAGNIQWTKRFLLAAASGGTVAQCYDSGYVVAYSDYSIMGSTIIIRMDQTGNVIYSRNISGQVPFTLMAESFLIPRPDGNVFVAGTVFDNLFSLYIWHVYELDTAGNVLWSHGYNSNASKMYLKDIDTLSNADLILLGSSYDVTASEYKTLITRITPTGNIVWSKEYGTAGYLRIGHKLVRLPGDMLHVLEAAYPANGGLGQINLMRIDGAGNELWTYKYHDANQNIEPSTLEAAGQHSSGITGVYQTGSFLLKNDSSGLVTASRSYPGTYVLAFDTLNNGNYVFTGWDFFIGGSRLFTTDQQGRGCDDSAFVLIKTPLSTLVQPEGDDTLIPIFDTALTIPAAPVTVNIIPHCFSEGITEARLLQPQVHPVPANNELIVTCSETIQTVDVISGKGQLIKQLSCSSPTATIDVSDLPPGIFFLRIYGGSGFAVTKIMVVH